MSATATQQAYIKKRQEDFDKTGLGIEDYGMYCSAYFDGHKAATLEAGAAVSEERERIADRLVLIDESSLRFDEYAGRIRDLKDELRAKGEAE